MDSSPTRTAHGAAAPLAALYCWPAKLWLLGAGVIPLLLLGATLDPGNFWWARVLAGLAFAGLTALLARISALAIIAWPDRLVIRNFRNTHAIPWAEIEEIFETPPPPASVYLDNPLYTQATEFLIRLREGSVISATLYSGKMFRYLGDRRRSAISQLTELQRQLSPAQPSQNAVPGSGRDLPS